MRHLIVAVAALVLSGGAGRTHTVHQKDKQFGAASLTIAPGDSIVFVNDDPVIHNVFASDDAFKFNLRAQKPGTSSGVAFDTPGTFHVRCAIHPTMKLVVTVTP